MKKFLTIMLSFALAFVICFSFTACGKKNKISYASIKAGSVASTVVKGEKLNLDDAIAIIKYSNNDTVEVKASDLTFSEVDTSTVGVKEITVTYLDYSFTFKVKVVATEADVASIMQLDSELITEFKSNRDYVDVNPNEPYNSFIDHSQPLYVGDANPFNFRIEASGVDAFGELVNGLTKVRTNITVEKKNSGVSYTELTGDTLNAIVKIDTENTTLDFTEAAVGNTYRVTVTAANPDPDYADKTNFSTELTVVSGWNVYSAKDLSLYDNTFLEVNSNTDPFDYFDWSTFRKENGYSDEDAKNIKGLILQQDIYITKDDVPDDVFWTEDLLKTKITGNIDVYYKDSNGVVHTDAVGTPIDYNETGMFHRYLSSGEVFNFIGNYFQVNISKFPKVVVENTNGVSEFSVAGNSAKGYVNSSDESGKYSTMTAHLKLFYSKPFSNINPLYSEVTNKSGSIAEGSKVNWKNIRFVGNGTITNNAEDSGAILLMEHETIDFEAYNTLTNNFYIGYFFKGGNKIEYYDSTSSHYDASKYNPNIGHFVVNKCKGFGSYNCLFYFFGAQDVVIKDSVFKEAGGPAMIGDQYDGNLEFENGQDCDHGYVTHVYLVNSEIESIVGVTSPWFNTYPGASNLSANIFDYVNNTVYGSNNSAKNITADKKDDYSYFNMIVLFKKGADVAENVRTQCSLTIFDNETEYNKFRNGEDYSTLSDLDMFKTTKQFNTNSPYGYINYSDIYTLNNAATLVVEPGGTSGQSNVSDNIDVTNPNCEYVNVYFYYGVGITFKLYPKAN